MKKLKFKHHAHIEIGDRSINVPIEFDGYDVIDYILDQSDSFKREILNEIMGNTDKKKVARWIEDADINYGIFEELRIFKPKKKKE